ncbi:MAG: prephenate dehydrogenase/arogenate dehydrogenase family protein [Verrucomicrobia bacterium]|nr:MAG: prephenate dehydrogenase/arogenate dehydrogenase family protein [Verrucomicrobiota bacterium]
MRPRSPRSNRRLLTIAYRLPARFNRSVHFQKITLAGVGLLGGSLGLAIKQRGLAKKVDGFVRRSTGIAECDKLGVVDHATRDPLRAVENADLIVLCTPLARMRDVLETMLPALKPGAIVTDVGSVKASVVQELEPLTAASGGHFIGSHPMAGAEKMGVTAARADLFVNAVCVLTPTPRSPPEAIERVEELWQAVGGRPLRMTPDEHDDLVSRSSHLPHVVAAELANYVLSPAHPKEQAMLCANGFRDTTRIASGSPEMWRDIALANRNNLARVLGVFIEDLQEFKLSLENADRKAIEEFFDKAKQRRDAWSGHSASPSPE